MAWGKEKFRTKYKESNDCLEKIKDNYYDLDYEYQMISKQLQQKENIIKEARKYIEESQEQDEDKESCSLYVSKLLEILNKGDDK